MLSHSLMKDSLPPYMTDLHIARQYYEIIQNTKKGMNIHLVRQRKSKVMMAKDIMWTLVTSHAMSSGRRITRLLGVDKWNIKKSTKHKTFLDTFKDEFSTTSEASGLTICLKFWRKPWLIGGLLNLQYLQT